MPLPRYEDSGRRPDHVIGLLSPWPNFRVVAPPPTMELRETGFGSSRRSMKWVLLLYSSPKVEVLFGSLALGCKISCRGAGWAMSKCR